jgi:hypothetical protein
LTDMTIPPPGDLGATSAPTTGAPPFVVTAPPELTLGPDRTGSTSFTVTNLTGRPVRTRLMPRGQAGAQDAWLSVVGPSEVPMAVAATLTATVLVQIPPEVPAGSHILALEVVAEDDTETVTGQSVSFVVPAPPQPKKFPWWWILVAVVVLALIAGLVIFFITRGGAASGAPVNTVPPSISGVPKVGEVVSAKDGAWSGTGVTFTRQWQRCSATGVSCSDIAGATGQSLTVSADQQDSTLKVVVTASNGQDPAVAESAPFGPIGVDSQPSTGALVNVPDFTGDLVTAAVTRARALGLAPTVRFVGQSCDISDVTGQDLAVGAQVPAGTPITLTAPRRLPPRLCGVLPR